MCFICRLKFIENRKFTVQRHFENCRSEFNVSLLSSDNLAAEILQLKNGLRSEQTVLELFLTSNEIVTRASHEIAFEIAKRGKPYSNGEFLKKLLQSTVETPCENCNEKLKRPKLLPLRHRTNGRRVNEIGTEIEDNLECDLERSQIRVQTSTFE